MDNQIALPPRTDLQALAVSVWVIQSVVDEPVCYS